MIRWLLVAEIFFIVMRLESTEKNFIFHIGKNLVIELINIFTCVWDERQLFGPYFDNLLSGSANRYSPSREKKYFHDLL